jgi:hypothetical protein
LGLFFKPAISPFMSQLPPQKHFKPFLASGKLGLFGADVGRVGGWVEGVDPFDFAALPRSTPLAHRSGLKAESGRLRRLGLFCTEGWRARRLLTSWERETGTCKRTIAKPFRALAS